MDQEGLCSDTRGFYQVGFRTVRQCWDSYEDEYLVHICGEITEEKEDESVQAGRISAWLVNYERAQEETGDSLWSILDIEGSTFQCQDLLVGARGELAEKVRDMAEGWISRLLLLDTIEILPEHRGRKLGLVATSRLLDLFEAPDILAVLQPWPFQFKDEDHWDSCLALAGFQRDRRKALRQLSGYWERLGFERAVKRGERELWALWLGAHRPSTLELLKSIDVSLE